MSMTGSGKFETSGIFESLPVSGWHRRLVVLVGVGAFFDLYEIFLGGVLASVLAKEFGLVSFGKAAVVASGLAGMFVGANVLSILADRFGRRRVFILNLLVFSLFSVAGAFSPNFDVFLVLRFLAGIGLGSELVLVDTYLAEFLPGKVRGRYTAWAYTVGLLGVPFAALLGGRLVAAREILGVAGWRWLLVIGGLGAVFVLAARAQLPESPRWLQSRGRHAEAAGVVRIVVSKVYGRTVELEHVSCSPPAPGEAEARTWRDVLGIAFGDYRKRTVMLLFYQVVQTVAYYGFSTLAPLVLMVKGFDVTQSLGYAALSFTGYPLGSLASVPLVERFERKYLIIVVGVAVGVFGIVFAEASSTVLIVSAGFLFTMASSVVSNSFHIYQAEIVPTAIRSTVCGVAVSLARATAMALPFVVVPLLYSVGPTVVFSGSATLVVLLCLDVGLLGPRSTGQPLEQVGYVSDPLEIPELARTEGSSR